ncbi:MAG: hypothetical protein ABL908_07400, partial [Hyphomicrobium sp.]
LERMKREGIIGGEELRSMTLGARASRRLLWLGTFLVCETIWAVGTVNWGTALRHHLPALGCLLVAGLAALPPSRGGSPASDTRIESD